MNKNRELLTNSETSSLVTMFIQYSMSSVPRLIRERLYAFVCMCVHFILAQQENLWTTIQNFKRRIDTHYFWKHVYPPHCVLFTLRSLCPKHGHACCRSSIIYHYHRGSFFSVTFIRPKRNVLFSTRFITRHDAVHCAVRPVARYYRFPTVRRSNILLLLLLLFLLFYYQYAVFFFFFFSKNISPQTFVVGCVRAFRILCIYYEYQYYHPHHHRYYCRTFASEFIPSTLKPVSRGASFVLTYAHAFASLFFSNTT